MNLDWDYDKRTCDISIQGYVIRQSEKSQRKIRKKQHAPSKFTPPMYGQKVQMAKEDIATTLTPGEIKRL